MASSLLLYCSRIRNFPISNAHQAEYDHTIIIASVLCASSCLTGLSHERKFRPSLNPAEPRTRHGMDDDVSRIVGDEALAAPQSRGMHMRASTRCPRAGYGTSWTPGDPDSPLQASPRSSSPASYTRADLGNPVARLCFAPCGLIVSTLPSPSPWRMLGNVTPFLAPDR